MAKSKQTSLKSDKEKKKKQRQKEKDERREFRKTNSNKGKGLDSMMAYLDHNGQLTNTPPDPKLKFEINAEDIQLGPQSIVKESAQAPKNGRIAIFNRDRNFGFIKDSLSQEKIFFHVSDANFEVAEGVQVIYQISRGFKGLQATNITKHQ